MDNINGNQEEMQLNPMHNKRPEEDKLGKYMTGLNEKTLDLHPSKIEEYTRNAIREIKLGYD